MGALASRRVYMVCRRSMACLGYARDTPASRSVSMSLVSGCRRANGVSQMATVSDFGSSVGVVSGSFSFVSTVVCVCVCGAGLVHVSEDQFGYDSDAKCLVCCVGDCLVSLSFETGRVRAIMVQTDVHKRYVFSGVDSKPSSGAGLPDEYLQTVNMLGRSTAVTFSEMVDRVAVDSAAGSAPVFYYDSEADEMVRVPEHRAVVNPNWLGEGREESPRGPVHGDNHACWSVFTSTYEPSSPEAIYEPLAEALREAGVSSDIFGEIRLYRDGGRAHVDLFAPEYSIEVDGKHGTEEIVFGISTGHDHFGAQQLYASASAFHRVKGEPSVVYRHLSDTYKRKHTGDSTADVRAQWSVVIDRLDRVSETVYEAVHDAMAYAFDFDEFYIESAREFFALLGLPETTVAADAGALVGNAVEMPSSFDLYQAGVRAVNQRSSATDTRTYSQHIATLNPLLFSPAAAERQVLTAQHARLKRVAAERSKDAQSRLSDDDSDSSVLSVSEIRSRSSEIQAQIETVDEGVDLYESVQDRLEGLLSGEAPSRAVSDGGE